MDWKISKAKGPLKGELTVPPDKSVSHRAVMFASISPGKCVIRNFLSGEDCLCTLEAFRAMGIDIRRDGGTVIVNGKGLHGLKAPSGSLFMGNSGTTTRILSGILAGQGFNVTLTGDESLSKRPMKRIMEPLSMMGAVFEPLEGGDHLPLSVKGRAGALTPINYKLPVASAQVKSCVLAAGLYADGVTSVTEPFQSRDHTERMMELFSADIKRTGLTTLIKGSREFTPRDVDVPGDISSAAFFLVGATVVEGSELILKNVGVNPTRRGILDVLARMGADIRTLDLRDGAEPSADLSVRYARLKGTTVEEKEIPLLIDEIPILAVAAATASGETVIKGVKELKVKETDRVKAIIEILRRMGAEAEEKGDSLVVKGGVRVMKKAVLDSFGDHRMAMIGAISALISDGECLVRDTSCVDTSYPGFLSDLENCLTKV